MSCSGLSIFPALLAGCAMLLAGGSAGATPLDEPACAALEDEQSKLVLAGVKSSMERGPEWARANLPAARLKEIERLIQVEEQIAFRCPQPKPVREAREPAGGNGAASEKGAAAEGAKGKAPPKPPSSAGSASPAPGQKPKAKAKAKPEDAYVPPPKAKPRPEPTAQ
ncbi:MAG: hypothetical protein KJZ80_15900 [Hyphomicrobiaceae bacterium]|nr:hypothetical protein [Hyphomicrobiaceae bacterium]